MSQEQYTRKHGDFGFAAKRSKRSKWKPWLCACVFGVADWPLMSSAMASLPVADWERFAGTAGASIICITLAHEIGLWVCQRHKSPWRVVSGWILIAVLTAILITASFVRHEAIKKPSQSPAVAMPEVQSVPTSGVFHA